MSEEKCAHCGSLGCPVPCPYQAKAVWPRIDWLVTVQAFALLGYEFVPSELAPDFDVLPAGAQLDLWGAFIESHMQCQLQCAWKGGAHCIHPECPRRVLRRVSLQAIELARRK